MIGTTAAILGSAALGLGGAAMSAGAAGKAAKAQSKAADQSIQFQKDTAIQGRIDAYPWALQGAQAMYMMMDELGIPRPQTPILPDLTQGPLGYNQQPAATPPAPAPAPAANALNTPNAGGGEGTSAFVGQRPGAAVPSVPANTAPAPNAIPSPANMPMTEKLGFQQTPGYQFQVEQGQQGVLNSLSAMGMKNSGKALKSLEKFGQGVANQEYNNWLNRIAGVAGMGQSQTNQTNSMAQNTAQNIGQAYQDKGAATASGYVGQANAWGQGLGQVGNALGQLSMGGGQISGRARRRALLMANSLVALQAQAPDVMNSFSQGQRQALGVQKEQREAAERSLQLIGSASMHALGGNINGQADPARFEEGLDMLESMGIPVKQFRGKPQLAPIAARASMSALQQVAAAQDERSFQFALEKFGADLSQFEQRMGLERQKLAAGDVPTGYQRTPTGMSFVPGGPADPNNPLNTRKITGPNLSVTAQKEIIEADEGVQAGAAVMSALDRALELNQQAYSGPMAETRGYAGSLVGIDNATATEELKNLVTTQALDQLRSTFGAMPTEGERKILLEIQGSVNQAPEVRKRIYERAKAAAERRINFARQKAEKLRSGEYFSEQPGDTPAATPAPVTAAPASAAASGEVTTKEAYDALPSGAEFMSGGKRYRKP